MSDLSSDLRALKIDRSRQTNPDAKSPWRWVLGVGLAVTAILLLYLVGVPLVAGRLTSQTVTVGEISMISPARGVTQLTATGYVESRMTSRVGPKVSGRVAKVLVEQGQLVESGAALYELDIVDQRAALAQATARMKAARAQAETAQANLAEVAQQATRAIQLAQDGVRPGAQADDLKARETALQKNLEAAQAQAIAAKADVTALSVTMSGFTVTTPIAGTVVSALPKPGEFVTPGAPAGEVEISDFGQLLVQVDVPEARVGSLAVDAPCEIVLDAFPQKRFRCKSKEIVPKVNRAKATVPVKVAFVDETTGVLPDMAARVSFLDRELAADAVKAPSQPVVPASAIIEEGGGTAVLVVENGKARRVLVTLGEAMGGGRVVKSGPPVGTRVVISPAGIKDGQSVKEKL